MKTRPKLILIDGHSLAYRAYFAMLNTPLSIENAAGEKELTGAVFAFTNMLFKVWKDEQPDYIAVAFDVGRTFRDDLYAEYKGTREKMPAELDSQLVRIRQVVDALGIPIFTKSGYEADDVLGTLARRAAGEGMGVVIVTGDRDALQLVNPAIRVLTSKQRFDDTIVYDETLVKEKYGVRPDQIIDYKALVGDTSDNVPGVKGIGEKTAQSLLNEYDTLDNVYAHLDDVTNKRAKTSLTEHKADALLSRDLVTIRTNVPLDVDWDACRAEVDTNRALSLLRELRFESLIKRLPQTAPTSDTSPQAEVAADVSAPTPAAGDAGQLSMFDAGALEAQAVAAKLADVQVRATDTHTRVVDSDDAFKDMLAELNGARHIAFDSETSSENPLTAEMVGMSFSVTPGQAWYVPASVAHAQGGWHVDPATPKFEPIARALARKDMRLIGHNAKFDLEVFNQQGHAPRLDGKSGPQLFDTMVAQFLVEPGGQSLGLKSLAFTYLGWQMTQISELIGRGKKQISMRDVPVDKVAPYAGADADATLRLHDILEPKLRERNQEKLFYEVEMPLVPVLMDMEETGIALDVKYLGQLSGEIAQRMRELERDIYELAGAPFNINSTQQLSDVLFGKLQLPTTGLRRTEQGAFSTAADVLESLQDKHPIVKLVLEHRELSKLNGTYVEALPHLINPNTGRVHTDYNQAGAVTGRLSSSNPNLQNIPIKTEMGRRVRKAFVPRKGWRLISADYSQVELRILAHLADDPTLKAAFERGEDIHASTASAIYDTPLKQVSSMQRMFAKRINFGIAYGMGAFALSQNTGMSQSDAQEFIRKYFARFPKVKEWLDDTKRIAASVGYVETVMGRRRYFPELQAAAKHGGVAEMQKRRAEREAINHPVQGSAADVMKLAMIHIHRALKDDGLQTKMMLQVHDELVFDCPANEVEAASELVRREMENAYPLSVVLKSDVAVGKNWDDVE